IKQPVHAVQVVQAIPNSFLIHHTSCLSCPSFFNFSKELENAWTTWTTPENTGKTATVHTHQPGPSLDLPGPPVPVRTGVGWSAGAGGCLVRAGVRGPSKVCLDHVPGSRPGIRPMGLKSSKRARGSAQVVGRGWEGIGG